MNKQKIRQKIASSHLSPKFVGSLNIPHNFFEMAHILTNKIKIPFKKKMTISNEINNVKLSLIKKMKNIRTK